MNKVRNGHISAWNHNLKPNKIDPYVLSFDPCDTHGLDSLNQDLKAV